MASPDRPPRYLVSIYRAAGSRYRLPWEVLAAINVTETNYGRDISLSPQVALGWMRFVPATWRTYAVAADGDGVAVPYDPRDAIYSAARYLAANGADKDLPRALFAYNHAAWYVETVLRRAAAIAEQAGSAGRVDRQMLRHRAGHMYQFRYDSGPPAAASSLTLRQAFAVAESGGAPHLKLAAPQGAPQGVLTPRTSWNPGGKPIAAWIVPVLQWAFLRGWTGTVTSGYRTYAQQAMINASGAFSAPAGRSNHESANYPGGAVDVTEPGQLLSVLRDYPGPLKLIGGVLGPVDPEHFSATGH